MSLLRKIGRSRLVKLPDGRKQIIDRFEVRSDAGEPANLSTVFLAWGAAHPKYTDCLLVQQPNLDFSRDQSVEQDLVRVYEEMPAANATPNEVQVGGDSIGKDADGRYTLSRQAIQLAAATLTEGATGSTVTVGSTTFALANVSHSSNGAVRQITRSYIEATASEVQVGGDLTGIDDNGRRTISRRFVQLASATYVEGTIGASLTVSTVVYGLNDETKQENGTTRLITRRWVQASTTLTQVGGEVITTDVDSRKRVSATFIQLLAGSTYTAGVVGTTTAPTTTSCVLSGEQVTTNSVLRTVARTYTQTPAVAATAEAVGPVVISYPFNHLGDAAHVIASQVYEQIATHYAPLALNDTRSVTVNGSAQTLYYIGDITPPGRQGSNVLRFTRQWANKPAPRTEDQTYAVTFPGIASTLAEYADKTVNKTKAREGFTEIVATQLTYTYYRIAASGGDYTSYASIPRDTVQRYYVPTWGSEPKSPFDTYLNNGESYGSFYWRPTVPTRTAYVALGTLGLIVECEVKRYAGPFYVRITRRATPL